MKGVYHFNEDNRLEPPDLEEFQQEDDFAETIEINLDAVVTVDKDGSWYYEDENYTWARCPDDKNGDWYTEEYNVYIGDPVDIVEDVDDIIEPDMPAIPGKYRISGDVKLVYNVSGVEADYDYFLDEDELPSYDKEVYTDNAEAEFDRRKSSVTNFQFNKLD